MKVMRMFLVLLAAAGTASAQYLNQDLPNSFTYSPLVPYGCLTVVPAAQAAPPEITALDQTVTLFDATEFAQVRVRAWRIGCHEPNASAIALNFFIEDGAAIPVYPEVALITPDESVHPAGLFPFARHGYYLWEGAALRPMVEQAMLPALAEGMTLVVDSAEAWISKQQYNGALSVRLTWPGGTTTEFSLPAHDAAFDAPQFENPVINGRYTGQYIVDGMPRQGLTLQVAELPPDRNYVFVTMYTYLDGQPVWVVGNADFTVGAHIIEVNMWMLEGGEFFTLPLDSYAREDVIQTRLGTMTLRARHCNVLDAEIDFSASGFGIVTRRFERLIRIAGYDCDQTR